MVPGTSNRYFLEAQHDNDIWFIILTGTGETAFCSCADLKKPFHYEWKGKLIEKKQPFNFWHDSCKYNGNPNIVHQK
jgi:enoyl-CoA hydratase/carnithine racemase